MYTLHSAVMSLNNVFCSDTRCCVRVKKVVDKVGYYIRHLDLWQCAYGHSMNESSNKRTLRNDAAKKKISEHNLWFGIVTFWCILSTTQFLFNLFVGRGIFDCVFVVFLPRTPYTFKYIVCTEKKLTLSSTLSKVREIRRHTGASSRHFLKLYSIQLCITFSKFRPVKNPNFRNFS